METMSLKEAISYINSLGYKIESSFSYVNNEGAKCRSHKLIESDTRMSAFHIDAKRGNNFKLLQEFRYNVLVYNDRKIEQQF